MASITKSAPATVTDYFASTPLSKFQKAWSNLANIKTWNNATYASAAISNSKQSVFTYRPKILRITNYGFSIYENARIDGVIVGYRGYKTGSGAMGSIGVTPINVGAVSKPGSSLPSSTPATRILGTSTEKWGASSLTPVNINSSSFGLAISIPSNTTAGTTRTDYIDGAYITVYYTDPTYTVTSNLPPYAIQGTQITYTIRVTNTNSVNQGRPIPISIPIPSGFSYVGAQASSGTFDTVTSKWNPSLASAGGSATLKITLQADTLGVQSQTVTVDIIGSNVVKSCEIVETDPDDISSCDIDLTTEYPDLVAGLVDGNRYTITGYCKITDTFLTEILQGTRNFKMATVQGSMEVLGERPDELGVYTRCSVSFTYDENETLILRLYGPYKDESPTTCTIKWAGLMIEPEGLNSDYSRPSPLLSDPTLLYADGTLADIIFSDVSQETTYRYLGFEFEEPDLSDLTFTGISLEITTADLVGCTISAKLISEDLESDILSTIITSETDLVTLGDNTENWGLILSQINNEELIVEVTIKDVDSTPTLFYFSNLKLILHYAENEVQGTNGFVYNGEHSSTYQLYMQKPSIPEGPALEQEFITVPMRDGNILSKQNIINKQLTVNFTVWGDTLTEAYIKLNNIVKWLWNERNELLLPTPYKLIFDHDPDRYYYAVLADVIETEIVFTSIKCTAIFNVPSGVGYAVDETITGAAGVNDGIIEVRPYLEVESDGSATLEVSDTISGLALMINHQFSDGDIVYIDCENRTVTSNDTDYSLDVDINSTWLRILNEFDIECTGGTVVSVTFREGY